MGRSPWAVCILISLTLVTMVSCLNWKGKYSNKLTLVAEILKLDIIFFAPPNSILGMHIFGCKFSLRTDTGDTVPDRKNFDSLLWAIVTVFQVSQCCLLWDGPTHDGIREATSK